MKQTEDLKNSIFTADHGDVPLIRGMMDEAGGPLPWKTNQKRTGAAIFWRLPILIIVSARIFFKNTCLFLPVSLKSIIHSGGSCISGFCNNPQNMTHAPGASISLLPLPSGSRLLSHCITHIFSAPEGNLPSRVIDSSSSNIVSYIFPSIVILLLSLKPLP